MILLLIGILIGAILGGIASWYDAKRYYGKKEKEK